MTFMLIMIFLQTKSPVNFFVEIKVQTFLGSKKYFCSNFFLLFSKLFFNNLFRLPIGPTIRDETRKLKRYQPKLIAPLLSSNALLKNFIVSDQMNLSNCYWDLWNRWSVDLGRYKIQADYFRGIFFQIFQTHHGQRID